MPLDPVSAVLAAITVLFGAGGMWTLLAARATARANKEIAAAASASANQQATTADWAGLMAYWQAELSALRATGTQLEVRVQYLERQREDDLQHIEDLEQHIWAELPPPPPLRRRYRRAPPEDPHDHP